MNEELWDFIFKKGLTIRFFYLESTMGMDMHVDGPGFRRGEGYICQFPYEFYDMPTAVRNQVLLTRIEECAEKIEQDRKNRKGK